MSLVFFVGLSLLFVAPACIIIGLMYRKVQDFNFQIRLWHYSSVYVSISILVLGFLMVLYTVLIYQNVNEIQKSMALEGGG